MQSSCPFLGCKWSTGGTRGNLRWGHLGTSTSPWSRGARIQSVFDVLLSAYWPFRCFDCEGSQNAIIMPFSWLQMINWRDQPRANDPPEGPASSKRSPGGTSLLKMIIQRAGTGLFLWKISFGTHMFIISGQTHNQKKNNEKLTVRWGSTLSVSLTIKFLCLFITPLIY